MGREILRMNQSMHADDINDTASVISAMINFPLADGQDQHDLNRRRRRRRFAKQNADAGRGFGVTSAASISDSEYDEHLKIDRILYNIYGDMMSTVRTTQVQFETYEGGDENDKLDALNGAIETFLTTFVHEQSEELIEALANLDLTAEMRTPSVQQMPTPNGNRPNVAAADNDQIIQQNDRLHSARDAADGDEQYSEKSSIISIQDIAPIVLPQNTEQIIDETQQLFQMDANDGGGNNTRVSNGSLILSNNQTASSIPYPAPRQASNDIILSPQATPIHVDHIPPSRSRLNSQSPSSSGHDSFFSRPTQPNAFASRSPNMQMYGGHDSMLTSHNTFRVFDNFSQEFQSLKNDFDDTSSFRFDKCDEENPSKFFSTEQQNYNVAASSDNTHDDNDNDNFDDFISNSFEIERFTPDVLSQRSQRKRPNLQNIRQNFISSQFSAHLGKHFVEHFSFLLDFMQG